MVDKEIAERFVVHVISGYKRPFSNKMCFALLPFNIVLALIAVSLYQNIYFEIIVFVYIAINILTSVIYKIKWSTLIGFICVTTQFVFFSVALDLICFSMYCMAGIFIWYEYLISIVIQLLSYILCLILTVISVKKFKTDNHSKLNFLGGAAGGLGFAVASIVCKLYLTNASLATVLTILSVIMNILIYLINISNSTTSYCAWLIKKFDLKL